MGFVNNPEILAKYKYRRRLPHIQKSDADSFVTFCTNQIILPEASRDLVLQHCLREGGILPFAGGAPAPHSNLEFTYMPSS